MRLDFVFVADSLEIAEPAGVIDGFHLLLGVKAFLPGAQAGIADVRRNDFDFPGRRNERLRRGHVEGKRIPQVVISEGVANQNAASDWLLAGGATGGPAAESVIAPLMLAAHSGFKNGFLQE